MIEESLLAYEIISKNLKRMYEGFLNLKSHPFR